MFLNPVQVESIDIKSATFLNANEAKTHHHQSCQCHVLLEGCNQRIYILISIETPFPCLYVHITALCAVYCILLSE